MVSKSALLRNIRPSGGLFTENIILRLRDNPDQLKIGKIETFLEKDTKEARSQFKEKRKAIFDWCVQKWDEISPNVEKWDLEELTVKWLIPFFNQFGYILENFQIIKENIDSDNPLKNFEINNQSKDHKNPFFHFISINEDLDSKIDENPQKKSYHNVCQQFINLNPEIKWLFLSNGRILRILTKYYHSYSKGFLEFDLENVFANRDEKEFNALYSIIHASRFAVEGEDHEFLINLFQKESVSEGIKIGDALRDNVHEALELIGNELVQENSVYLEKMRNKEIDLTEYYAELLRIIYRIIFILYAEQRGMLPGAGTIYFEHFSLSSLRDLAEKPLKIEKSYDLWNKLFLTFKLIKDGNDFLVVTCYNGSLFKDENLSIILSNKLRISNDILLRIIKLLTTSINITVRQKINFLEIREEEIGAVYESLLDYKPYFSSNLQFQLIEGTERKSTGSYYTPKELIDILIRTTLHQLVEDRLEMVGDDTEKKEKAILNLKVCDPACGGGTFLLAAMDFLGKKLAEIRVGSDASEEEELRQARRDVLQHCIYGVDKNPLAVELAKISLWLRACVKDKPLNYLDNHIKCGDSLIGLGQKIIIENIDINAFKAIKGNKETGISDENSKLLEMTKRRIRTETTTRGNIRITSFMTDRRTGDICSTEFQKIIDSSEDTAALIIEKEEKYNELIKNINYQQTITEANIWTSTFFWSFEGNTLGEIPKLTTIEQLRNNIIDSEISKLLQRIIGIAKAYQFFHWYIEFPEVFSSSKAGFDCIITNPPWETLQLKENEFFVGTHSEILNASNQAERRKLIKKLKEKDPDLFNKYEKAWIATKKLGHYLTTSGFYSLSARGTINTYALFVERCWNLINPDGYAGIICPTGVITNYHLQDLFKTLVLKKSILSIFDFENRNKLFNIDSRYRFCLMSLGGSNISQEIIPMTFYAVEPKQIQEPISIIFEDKQDLKEKVKKLPDNHILIMLKQSDFELFNPNTLTCPSFRIKKDVELLRQLYQQAPILIKRHRESDEIISNIWNIVFMDMFHSSNDSNLFLTRLQLKDLKAKPKNISSEGSTWIDKNEKEYYPLYEGRMIWHYNHRLNSMNFAEEGKKRKAISIETNIEQYRNFNFSIYPNYWVEKEKIEQKIPLDYKKKWFLCFRGVTGATNERTFISTIIPFTAVADNITLILSNKDPDLIYCLLANLNSIIFDYITRQKISIPRMNHYVVEQCPVISPVNYSFRLKQIISKLVLELIYTAYDLKFCAEDLGYKGEPFEWNPERKALLQSELDAIYALLYKVNLEDLIYILDSFTGLKNNEMKKFNEFKTKRLILEAYDRFSQQKELFE